MGEEVLQYQKSKMRGRQESISRITRQGKKLEAKRQPMAMVDGQGEKKVRASDTSTPKRLVVVTDRQRRPRIVCLAGNKQSWWWWCRPASLVPAARPYRTDGSWPIRRFKNRPKTLVPSLPEKQKGTDAISHTQTACMRQE